MPSDTVSLNSGNKHYFPFERMIILSHTVLVVKSFFSDSTIDPSAILSTLDAIRLSQRPDDRFEPGLGERRWHSVSNFFLGLHKALGKRVMVWKALETCEFSVVVLAGARGVDVALPTTCCDTFCECIGIRSLKELRVSGLRYYILMRGGSGNVGNRIAFHDVWLQTQVDIAVRRPRKRW